MKSHPLPEVDFSSIRVCRGTQHGGFEELSVSLFRAEFGVTSEVKRVEGSGGDGGVEAFVNLPSGGIVGLQAKYFRQLKAKQWAQIEDSVRHATETHTTLRTYIVVVPLDRTPAALKRWNTIEAKWRTRVALLWWGQSELTDFLSRADHHGRLLYWFGEERFDASWVQRHNETATRDLDTRYTPAHHIRTEPEELLEAVALTETFTANYERLMEDLARSAQALIHAITSTQTSVAVRDVVERITARLPELGDGSAVVKMAAIRSISKEWSEAAHKLWLCLTEASRNDSGEGAKASNRDKQPYAHELQLLSRWLQRLGDAADFAKRYQCVDSQFVVLFGPVGTGKSHVLANLVRTTEAAGRTAILLLGEYFLSPEEPWSQLVTRLGWRTGTSALLAALNYSAEIVGRPALLCIDALNESGDRRLWRSHLQAFATRLQPYPWIRLIVSCRDDFANLTLPPPIAEKRDPSWANLNHQGFGEDIFEAVASYFQGYSVRSRHFPPLLAEFRNPLFLKTFCEAFENSALPDGPVTLATVMEARIDKVCSRLLQDIDCPVVLTRKAISLVAEQVQKAGGAAVPLSDVRALIDPLLPGRGESQSLYRHLHSNGLLVEVIHWTDGPETEAVAVRFPFERFSEYFIAQRMLKQHSQFKTLRKSWAKDGTLKRFRDDSGYGPLAGVASAMAILVPERFGREFASLFRKTDLNEPWIANFLESLPWRGPKSFSAESEALMRRAQEVNYGAFLSALLDTSTIPGHPYNADYLHSWLRGMPLPDRELAWTIPICEESMYGGADGVAMIVRWAFRVPVTLVSDEQAVLVSRVLAWLCSNNHRALRFRATLAAIRLLAGRSRIAAQIVRSLHDVNDPYVVERVFAIAAGVAMRERDGDSLRELASAVFTVLFDQSEVPSNVLVRDYASSILEIAEQRSSPPSGVSAKDFRPPYRSRWPRIWTEAKTQKVEDAKGWNVVRASVQPECIAMYGDFGRYTMQADVGHFTEIPLRSRRVADRDARRFDPMTARRWVVQRVFELGWTPERFRQFEQNLPSQGRSRADIERTRPERIGKKYQWIALNELLGYLSDHYKMRREWYDEEQKYRGAWQLYARDFDPSQPLVDVGEDADESDPASRSARSFPWWYANYPDPFENPALCSDPNAWVRQPPADFQPLISWARVPDSASEHLALGGYYTWDEPTVFGADKPRAGRLRVWCHIRAWLVPTKAFQAALTNLKTIQFWGEGCHIPELHHQRLGAYPWGAEFTELKEFCAEPDRWIRDAKVPIEQTMVQWGEDDLSGLLPSPRLIEFLGIRWSGYDFDFVDRDKKRVAFSPHRGRGGGSSPLFVHKDSLLPALRAKGWDMIWAVVGDRTCYDFDRNTHVADAEIQFSALYWLRGGKLHGGLTRIDMIPIPHPIDK